MSRRLAAGLAAATLVAMTLFAAPPASAQNINQARAECNQPSWSCRGRSGGDLNQCLLHNGHIEHACNIVHDWEAQARHGGCGPKCDAANQKRNNTSRRNAAEIE